MKTSQRWNYVFFLVLVILVLSRYTEAVTSKESANLESIPVLLQLEQKNIDELERLLVGISHPKSPLYGRHLKAEDIADIIAPSETEMNNIIRGLEELGASSIQVHRTKDYISCQFPPSVFDRLFQREERTEHVGTEKVRMSIHKPRKESPSDVVKRYVKLAYNLQDSLSESRHTLLAALASRRREEISQGLSNLEQKSRQKFETYRRRAPHVAENVLGGHNDLSPFLPPPIPLFNTLSTSDNGFYLLVVPVCADNQLSHYEDDSKHPFSCYDTDVSIEKVIIYAKDAHNSSLSVTKTFEGKELSKYSYNLKRWCKEVYESDPVAFMNYAGYCEKKMLDESPDIGVMVIPLPGTDGAFFDEYVPIQLYAATKFSNDLESAFVAASGSSSAPTAEPYTFMYGQADIPPVVRKSYDIPPYDKKLKVFHNNTIMAAIGCGLNYFFNPSELDYFLHTFGQESVHVKVIENPLFPVKNNPDDPGVEPSLDIEQQSSLAYMSEHFFMPSNTKHCSTYLENILYYVGINELSDDHLPLVISQSSAFVTPDNLLPSEFIQATNVEFLKLAVRGVTYAVSAGDWGASGRYEDGNFGCYPYMAPIYPASSPFVTSVGASQPLLQIENGEKKILTQVCSADQGGIITGGGGHSWVQEIPFYQKEAVAAYQKQLYQVNTDNLFPPNGSYNPHGRGYPDVALFGWNTPVYTEQPAQWVGVGGTSISAPMFASMVSMLNYERLSRGMPPMGFINPFLYYAAEVMPEAFLDITIGNNRCTEFGNPCCLLGFPALKGWDPASGLGSPLYEHLLKLALSVSS
ncbi:Physarolisin [Galdieria sulphuraria]|uniref:Tripeptidyl-peptidase I n=1 Tax=Galdieria sulphuraria TaxID=130081 RepID=M2VSL5_GALSU|nr:tripeptidyl-peptidase I [Galdieria sulphuraria]EME26136.1 tripeptidyl-peptidase I [Galdieria sulphuraria]GJD10044.1 Physarolisin [Galdieria sulphuraria]|eukprot:XP_005702656.1 tripeptidyl-peptidase I [Galdieria sulphuraria]